MFIFYLLNLWFVYLIGKEIFDIYSRFKNKITDYLALRYGLFDFLKLISEIFLMFCFFRVTMFSHWTLISLFVLMLVCFIINFFYGTKYYQEYIVLNFATKYPKNNFNFNINKRTFKTYSNRKLLNIYLLPKNEVKRKKIISYFEKNCIINKCTM